MSESTPDAATVPAPAPQQLSLPGAQELFAAVGLDTLPIGAAELNTRQLKFALAYLGCANLQRAAEIAGYSPESADKVRKTPAIARFLNASLKTVAQNGDQLVLRKFELSVSYHAELKELRSVPLDQRTEKSLRREATVALMAVRNDTLLAALLNRLGIKLSADVTVNHTGGGSSDFMVIPPDALAGFAQARQESAALNRLAAHSGGKN